MRSILEGVSFALKSVLEVMEESDLRIDGIRLIGGGAKGKLWRKILSDIYGKKLLLLENLDEASSYGAGISAGIGLGIFKDYGIAKKLNRIKEIIVPDRATKMIYEKIYSKFKSLYPALKNSFRELVEGV